MKQSSMNLLYNMGHMMLDSTALACNVLSRNARYKFANTGARGVPMAMPTGIDMTRVRTAKGSLYFELLGASFFLIELLASIHLLVCI